MRLVAILAGGRWAQLEEHGLRDDQYSFRQLQEGVGDETYQKALAEAIQRRIVGWLALEPTKRAEEFAGAVAIYRHRTTVQRTEHRFAEFLLRLASDPATLADWPESEVRPFLERIVESPLLIRAARFLVLAVHIDEDDDTGTTFRGWSWT